MKTLVFFRRSAVLAGLLFASLAHAQAPAVSAQPTAAQPAAATAQPGYWNLETNGTTRDYTHVRFYDGHDRLVYEERLAGLCLDLSRSTRRGSRRLKQQLAEELQAVLRDPAAAGQTPDRLARQFGADRRVLRAYAVR